MNSQDFSSLFLGSLERRTLIAHPNHISIDQSSGDLLYAAAAHKLLGQPAAIFAHVGQNFPPEWIETIQDRHIDCAPLARLNAEIDHRNFTWLSEDLKIKQENPIVAFAQLKAPLPKSLLDYEVKVLGLDERKKRLPSTWREEDLPDQLDNFSGAHLCPHDYLSHRLIPGALRAAGIKTITLESRKSYMHPDFRNDLPELVNGLSAFITTQEQMDTIFTDQRMDIWEKAAYLGEFNCESVIIFHPGQSQYVYLSAEQKRYQIPPYPANILDLSFSGSSFAGAHLAALLSGEDLLQSALCGAAVMSIATQAFDPFYVLDSYIGLAQARKESLAQAVKII